MNLTPTHAEYLAAHAVDLDFARALGVRSVASVDELPDEWRAGIGRHLPGILFPWTSRDGRQCVQLRPDTPSTNPEGNKIKYVFQQDVSSVLWEVRKPPTNSGRVLIVEGSKQCLVAAKYAPAGFAVYGVAGCWGWSSDTIPIPDLEVADGKEVVVIFDADAGSNLDVWLAATRLSAALTMEGARKVGWVRLPAGKKAGLDDLLATRAEDRREAILDRLITGVSTKVADRKPKAKVRKTIEPDSGRPPVVVDGDRLYVIDAIADALIQRWDGTELFSHGGVISQLVSGVMHPVDKGTFNDLLISAVSPVTENPDGSYSHCWPDLNTMITVLAKSSKFTPLERISSVPFVRPDGTVCVTPGYDEATRTLFAPPHDLGPIDVPDHPSAAQVVAARELLLDGWLGDMPFPDEASRANALALVLTPFIRGLVYLAPLAVVNGLQMGVGKNLFADCVSMLVTGKACDPKLLNTEDDENRKMILSAFRAGSEFMVFDEAHTIAGNSLARAVTALTYSDRVLGVSTIAEFPNRVTWMSLGNQVIVRGDMTRRVYQIALAPDCADPQDRPTSSFVHPDLRGWTRDNRPRLIEACLTLVRAWFAENCPTPETVTSFGSFEKWQQMTGGILSVAGVAGFLNNLHEWRTESDSWSQWWASHLAWCHEQFGDAEFSAAAVKTKAMANLSDYDAPLSLDDVTDKAYAKKLGEAYSRVKNRRFKRFWINKVGEGHRGVAKWRVYEMGVAGGVTLDEPDGFVVPTSPAAPEGGENLPNSNGVSGALAGSTGEDHGAVALVDLSGGVLPSDSGDGLHDVIPVHGAGDVEGLDRREVVEGLLGFDGGISHGVSVADREGDAQRALSEEREEEAGSAPLERCAEREVASFNKGGEGVEGRGGTELPLDGGEIVSDLSQNGGSGGYEGTSSTYAYGNTRPSTNACEGTRVRKERSSGAPYSPSGSSDLTVRSSEVLVVDLETASANDLHSYGPGFVRLAGWSVAGSGHVELTTDFADLVTRLSRAGLVVGHNVLGFDLLALARHHGLDLAALAKRGGVFDTMLAARQWDPPMAKEAGIDHERRYNLDRLGERFEIGRKVLPLGDLAKEFGGYDQIPVDDQRYREYLVGDVDLSEKVYNTLVEKIGEDTYLEREHRVAAVAAQISLNGFRVDTDLLAKRVDEGEKRKQFALARLHERYGIPLLDSKGSPCASPLSTKAGKAALVEAFGRHGVTSFWTTGKTGDIAVSYEAMKHLALQHHHIPAVLEICKLVGAVVTVRTVYTTIADNLIGADRVHPSVVMKQSTGRWSLSRPGLTVMGKRGGRFREREVFIPDPGQVIVAFDLAQIDMRALAGLSNDRAYIEMLRTSDPHSEIAKALFGDASKRDESKAIGHGWNYGRGVRAISDGNDLAPDLVKRFDESMKQRFPRLVEWRDEVRAIAASGELLDNGFGRRMRPDPMRSHTQGPALMGQGCARDLMMEGLLRLPIEVLPMLRAQVHDEIVLSVPEGDVVEVSRAVTEALSFEWRGVPILAEGGPSGRSWGAVYDKEQRGAA